MIAIEAQPLEPSTHQHLTDAEMEQLRRRFDDLSARHAAALEDHQADTEELRTTLEKLEAGRKEQQALNEELTAANTTLKERLIELGRFNGDLQNLMAATNIATVFLDRELRITRCTPNAIELFKLIPTDLGHPLEDVRNRPDYPELERDAAQGLGLAIAKATVEAHGGTLRASSPGPGQGATFTVSLLLSTAHAGERARGTA